MVRSTISAVVVAILLATTLPAFAEPHPVQAPEQSDAADQSASPAYSRASSPDAGTPAKSVTGKDNTPFGFGWG